MRDLAAILSAAYTCDADGRESEAVAHYDAAWRLGVPAPQRAAFMLCYGSTLKNVGRLAESEAILRQALAETPDDGALPAFLALTLQARGRDREAVAVLLGALLSQGGANRDIQAYSRALAGYRDELLAEQAASAPPPFDTPIEMATLVGVAPERVYETLTTASGWDAWFTQGAEVDLAAKRIVLRWPGEGIEDGGPILWADPPSRFAFQWSPVPGGAPTTVSIDLEPRDGSTLIRLKESGYPDTPAGRAAFGSCATGWGEALTLLKFYLERGITRGPGD